MKMTASKVGMKNVTTMLVLWAAGLVLFARLVAAGVHDLRISEFMASNAVTIKDKDGEYSDWIEIHNTGDTSVNMVGLYLTDTINTPVYEFPSYTLAANGYVLVFASSKIVDPAIELHANLKLSASGEYLGLLAADNVTVIHEYAPTFPSQTDDVSFGIDSNGNIRYFSASTPGTANGVGDIPKAAGAVASVDRGFYDNAFTVELTTTQPSGQIRYTKNGSEPTASSGSVYSSAVTINDTTVLRTATFATGLSPSPTSTYSYIFLAKVIQQPVNITGFPNGRSQSTGNHTAPLDMAMDQAVVTGYSSEIMSAMTAIPTMSLTASLDDIFGSQGGFYFGVAEIEKKCSIEILYGSMTGTNEQIDVGVEAHSHDRLKRSLRLNFRAEYGKKEWKTPLLQSAPLHGDSATDKHRTLILRGGNNRCWARDWNPDATDYTVDQFYRDSQVAVSGIGSRGTFVHLYLNGVYWGVYNLVERTNDEYMAEYFGGSNNDWFFAFHGGLGSADPTRWNYLMGALSEKDMSNATNYAEMQQYLNVESFADYILLAFYIGLTDWPDNNWFYGHRNDASPLGSTPGNFFAWDGEWSFDRRAGGGIGNGAYIQSAFLTNRGSLVPIVKIWHSLRGSPNFRDLFSSRVALHTTSGGALSPEAATARYDTLNSYIELAIIGESARWGDSLKTLGGKYNVTRTRDVDWYTQVSKIRGILLSNTETLINALIRAGFYTLPTTPTAPIAQPAAPVASPIAPLASPTALVADPTPSSSTALTLVDASADVDIGPLTDGMTINLYNTASLSIRADPDPSFSTGSVQFLYDGVIFRTEKAAAWAFNGNSGSNYVPWTPSLGVHTIVATPFSAANAQGTSGDPAIVTFTVINQAHTA